MLNQKILGIITARGGSKRVPGKNIKNFLGKPLLAWTIEVGQASGVLDRFILSTDDDAIMAVGREYGIEAPFKRPVELASDTAGSYEVIKHSVEWLKDNENYQTDWIILLEPSAPGRQKFHIQDIAKMIKRGINFDSVVGITKVPGHFSYLKQLSLKIDNSVSRVGDHEVLCNLTHRNQDINPSYYINSNIYAFKTNNLFNKQSLWGGNTYGYVMDEKYAIDIDTPEDWIVAEAKMKQLIKNKK